MKTELEFVELHSPLFLAGTNLGQKLDPNKRTTLKLFYDEETRHVYVTWQGKTARVPEPSVLSMVEGSSTPRVDPAPAEHRATAQVTTPQSHVFAGPGAGQTGQERPKGKVLL